MPPGVGVDATALTTLVELVEVGNLPMSSSAAALAVWRCRRRFCVLFRAATKVGKAPTETRSGRGERRISWYHGDQVGSTRCVSWWTSVKAASDSNNNTEVAVFVGKLTTSEGAPWSGSYRLPPACTEVHCSPSRQTTPSTRGCSAPCAPHPGRLSPTEMPGSGTPAEISFRQNFNI